MFYVIRLKRLGSLSAVLCFLLAGFILLRALSAVKTLQAAELWEQKAVLVIDAGHGGFDGGAVAVNGVKESDVNLAIAQKLQLLAAFCGQETRMTRADDSRRTELLNYSEHEDLANRVQIANSVPNAVLISIHQNYYPTTQPWGAQVLYADDPDSALLGRITQSNLVSSLQPENRRLAEPASPKLYLTSHADGPAILVECGFLSNYNEMEKLTEDSYQTSLAAVLIASYLQFLPGMGSV